MEQVTTVGIDLAKKVLCILAMDFNQPSANGKERLIATFAPGLTLAPATCRLAARLAQSFRQGEQGSPCRD